MSGRGKGGKGLGKGYAIMYFRGCNDLCANILLL